MASFNKVILMGNLTRDPEVRVTPSGVSICKFGIAVSKNVRTADGGTREETLFVDIDSFGKQAELIGKHMTKGRAIRGNHRTARSGIKYWLFWKAFNSSVLG